MKILLDSIEVIWDEKQLDVSSANPFLDNDEDRLDNIFSVEIPIVGNEKALGYIDNIDIVKTNEYKCEVISSLNFIGVAIVTEASTENNKATLQIGYAKSNFNYLIKDKKMKELDFGSIICAEKVNLQTTPWASPISVGDTGDAHRYALAFNYISGNANYYNVHNLYFPENIDAKINVKISLYFVYPGYASHVRAKVYYQKNNGVDVLIADSGDIERTETYVELMTTFNIDEPAGEMVRIYIDTENHYMRVPRAMIDCTILSKEFVINANSDDNSSYCFPMIQNNDMMNQLPDGLSKTFYDDKYPLLNNIFTLEHKFYKVYNSSPYTKLLAPCLKVSFVLNTLFESLGYMIDMVSFEGIYKKLLLFSGTIIADYKSSNTNFYLDLPVEFALNKCFENDILISDFLNDLYVVTGFFPIFNHEARSVKFVSLENLYKKTTAIDMVVVNDTINLDYENKGITVEIDSGEDSYQKDNYNDLENYNFRGNIATLDDIATDIELNDCYYITSERKYYAYTFGKATDDATTSTLFWKFISYDFRLKKEDGKETFVSFKSDTPIMVGVTTSITGDGTAAYSNINIPVTQQAIRINKAYETYSNKYSNSFLINRGLKTKEGLGEYLYASADSYFGQTQENGISLRVDDENGIMKRSYQMIAQLYKTGKKHTINGHMTADEINKLTYENLIYINGCVNILLSYNYKLNDNELMEIELELIKI